jgi:solute carrier family 35 (UDP-xylose/UDP-N-acetylglucosamine transporter), member B4
MLIRVVLTSSNALTLEEITKHYSGVGTLLTFSQFLIVALVALPSHLTFSGGPESTGLSRLPYPRLKPRQLPLLPYLAQVALYYGISRLNNAAFAYAIPMTVHIIFRSGGLVVSLLLGWILLGRR